MVDEHASTEECWALLGTEQLGRLGVIRGGYPLIAPVNYTVHRGRIVLRSDRGAKHTASQNRRVSFEADRIDSSTHTGWSVHALAFGTELSRDDPAYEELRDLELPTWAPGAKPHVLVLTPITVSGRRLERVMQPGH